MKHYKYLLATDIDNTLTGDPEALKELRNDLEALRKKGELFLVLSTGRRLNQVLDGFENEFIPRGDAIVSQVGTEIYLPPFSLSSRPNDEWNRKLNGQFSRGKALEFVEGIEGLELQPEEFNTPLKVSCYLDKAPDPEKAVEQIRRRIEDKGESCQVVWSSGRDLDIIPADAGKGKAIRFLINHLELSPKQVIVAGDSGNDRSMFDEFESGIIVGNAKPELKKLQEEHPGGKLFFAEKLYAAGVLEGLKHFGVL
ncbi:MAG: hypothetical protein DRP87_03705 [Spirochaetes bacterium]|nr:MAG: hypothetical protein DRP87_03705 [Spirochaetota bacterium]